MFGWFKRKEKETSNQEIDADEINEIVNSYGKLLENTDPTSFYDTKMLPHGRDKTLKALVISIKVCDDTKILEMLNTGLLLLFHFRDGIGDNPIKNPDHIFPSMDEIDKMTIEDIQNDAKSFLDKSEDRKKWQELQQLAINEYNKVLNSIEIK